jgi:hypothetical protein
LSFFFPPWRYYILLPSSKILEVHSCFWHCESLPELPKNPFWDFGPLGVKHKMGHSMFAILTQAFKSNQWQLKSSLRQPMGVEACCTWRCSNKNKASVSFRSTYTLDFNNSSFIMSDSENYETTFNHFLLHFLRYLCNFCPNTCSQHAILMKFEFSNITCAPITCVHYVVVQSHVYTLVHILKMYLKCDTREYDNKEFWVYH